MGLGLGIRKDFSAVRCFSVGIFVCLGTARIVAVAGHQPKTAHGAGSAGAKEVWRDTLGSGDGVHGIVRRSVLCGCIKCTNIVNKRPSVMNREVSSKLPTASCGVMLRIGRWNSRVQG